MAVRTKRSMAKMLKQMLCCCFRCRKQSWNYRIAAHMHTETTDNIPLIVSSLENSACGKIHSTFWAHFPALLLRRENDWSKYVSSWTWIWVLLVFCVTWINEKHVAAFVFIPALLFFCFFVRWPRSITQYSTVRTRNLRFNASIPVFFYSFNMWIYLSSFDSLFKPVSWLMSEICVLLDEWIKYGSNRMNCLHAKRKKRQKQNITTLKHKHITEN